MYYTSVNIRPFSRKITYSDSLFFIGSCFSDEIAQKLLFHKFNVLSNPFGTLYNPVSIYQSLKRIVLKDKVQRGDFFLDGDIYKSFHFHSSIAGMNLNEVLDKTNSIIEASHDFLKNSNLLFITYGSSYVFEFKKTGQIVANCHKVPASEFHHRMLTDGEVLKMMQYTVECLRSFNPKLQIIFTVSPVRYLKYGSFENQVSKSLLFVSLSKILQQYADVFYFPAYEIFMDELRDYRFYASDMLHPSDDGVEHVWKRFKEALIEETEYELMKRIEEIKQACLHKPMFPQSTAYKSLRQNILSKIVILEQQYAFLNFDQEKSFLFYDSTEKL
jgi:hypothetical protein